MQARGGCRLTCLNKQAQEQQQQQARPHNGQRRRRSPASAASTLAQRHSRRSRLQGASSSQTARRAADEGASALLHYTWHYMQARLQATLASWLKHRVVIYLLIRMSHLPATVDFLNVASKTAAD